MNTDFKGLSAVSNSANSVKKLSPRNFLNKVSAFSEPKEKAADKKPFTELGREVSDELKKYFKTPSSRN